jgi:hypothetical protein
MRKIAYVVGSLILSACGGGGGSDTTTASNTNKTASATSTTQAYFTEVSNAFPDPTNHFLFYNKSLNNSLQGPHTGKLNAAFSVDLNNDGRKEFVMVVYKGSGHDINFGKYASEPCGTTTIIYTLNGDKFIDVTDAYLESERDFKACITDDHVAIIDVNGDGKPDMFFSPNQEDGRNYQLGSMMTSPIVGWLSQPNGKYKIASFGPHKWYHSIGSGIDSSGNIFITGNGHLNKSDPNNLRYVWNGREMQTVFDQYFPNISPHKFIFLSKQGKASDTLIQHYTSSEVEMAAIGYYQENNIWYKTNIVTPPIKVLGEETFEVWSTDTRKIKVIEVEGHKVAGWGANSGLNGFCEFKLYKDQKPVVATIYNMGTIPNYVPGKLIKETELVPTNFFATLDVNEKVLTYKRLHITGETNFGPGKMQCMDVNKDGYDDIVLGLGNDNSIRHQRIYINQKDGTLKKLELTNIDFMNLSSVVGRPVDLYGSHMDDYDNDGLIDVIIYPSNHGTNSTFNGILRYYRGSRAIP